MVKAAFVPGEIVGVVIKGQALLGRLLSSKGSKAALSFGGQRRDQEVPQRDLIGLPGLDPEVASAALPTPEDTQARQPQSRAAAEVWWLLMSDHDGPPEQCPALSITELAELLTHPLDLTGLAAVWSWLHGDQLWFRVKRDRTIQPKSSDEIRRQRLQARQALLAERLAESQLALLREPLPLTGERFAALTVQWQTNLERLIDRSSEAGSSLDLSAEEANWLRLLQISADPQSLRQWLIRRELVDAHEPRALRGSVWSKHFSDALDDEAQRLIAAADGVHPGDDTRLDLTGLTSYTLDDAGTREIDDALSLERQGDQLWVWIHIADPARLIAPDTPLDCEAKRRATTLYLGDGVLPMLPLELAAGPLSLKAGQRSAALSVAVRLADDGTIIDQRISRSWIQPRYGLTYEDGDELIELAPPGDEDLADLAHLMQTRAAWRRRQGAVQLDRLEGRFRRHNDAVELQVIEPSPARLMVSEAMLLMGAVVADYGRAHGLALPYRSQPPAELPSEAELEALPEGPVRDAAIKRCLSRGVQGTQPMAHFSLGLEAYVQATSPIRRYADLLTHRQLIASLTDQTPLEESRVGELIDDLDDPLRQSIQISREDQRHWQQVWFAEHREQTWSAQFLRWLRPQDRLALVHVDDLAMDLVGQVQGGEPVPGDRLNVEVTQVDPERGELQLQLI
ncbi:MAG: ribonuclease catalytic domain-containing protein [Synechococcus sp.]